MAYRYYLDVLETGGRVDRETDQENVGLRVTQGTQTIVILLSSSIKQSKRVRFVTDPTTISQYSRDFGQSVPSASHGIVGY
jgi:hypothetical protein